MVTLREKVKTREYLVPNIIFSDLGEVLLFCATQWVQYCEPVSLCAREAATEMICMLSVSVEIRS